MPESEDEFKDHRFDIIARDLAAELRDLDSLPFYRKLVRICWLQNAEHLYFQALSEMRDAEQRGLIRTTRARYFTDRIKRLAAERRITLSFQEIILKEETRTSPDLEPASSDRLILAKLLAMAGLPRSRRKGGLSRTLRLGNTSWVRVTYNSIKPNSDLPFGVDRLYFAAVQTMAIERCSPIVTFETAGEVLKRFGIPTDGRQYRRLREGFARLKNLVIQIEYLDDAPNDCSEAPERGRNLLPISDYSLPARKDLRLESAGALRLPLGCFDEQPGHPFGLRLSSDFWDHLNDIKNRIQVPIKIMRAFLNEPVGWDFTLFVITRSRTARTKTVISQEALLLLFRDGAEPHRNLIGKLRGYLQKIKELTDGKLPIDFELKPFPKRSGGPGQPAKEWQLIIRPSDPMIWADRSSIIT